MNHFVIHNVIEVSDGSHESLGFSHGWFDPEMSQKIEQPFATPHPRLTLFLR